MAARTQIELSRPCSPTHVFGGIGGTFPWGNDVYRAIEMLPLGVQVLFTVLPCGMVVGKVMWLEIKTRFLLGCVAVSRTEK